MSDVLVRSDDDSMLLARDASDMYSRDDVELFIRSRPREGRRRGRKAFDHSGAIASAPTSPTTTSGHKSRFRFQRCPTLLVRHDRRL